MAYQIRVKESAQEELEALPKRVRGQVERKILMLAKNPRPSESKPLQSKRFTGLRRVRSGDYRIIYQIQDRELIVLIVKIGDRQYVYD